MSFGTQLHFYLTDLDAAGTAYSLCLNGRNKDMVDVLDHGPDYLMAERVDGNGGTYFINPNIVPAIQVIKHDG